MGDVINYTAELPTAPPEGLLPWLLERGQLKKELLIYSMAWWYDPAAEKRERKVKLKCTACGGVSYAEKVEAAHCAGYSSAPFGFLNAADAEAVISGQATACPECGADVEAWHIGSIRGLINIDCCYAMTVSRLGDKLLLTGWIVTKKCGKDGAVQFESHGYEAYVIEEKRVVRLKAYTQFMSSFRWDDWKQLKSYSDTWGETVLVYPWDADILIGSAAENSKLDVFMQNAGSFPVTYLRLWQRYPAIENLVTQGAGFFLNEMIKKSLDGNKYPLINRVLALKALALKEKSPSKMLGMDRPELKRFVREKWTLDIFKLWRIEKEAGRPLTKENIKLAESFRISACFEFRDMGADWLKALRYLKRQQAKNKNAGKHILTDYWRIAEITGEDLSVPEVRYPPRLMAAHDRVEKARQRLVVKQKDVEAKTRAEAFDVVFQRLAPMAWEFAGLFIRSVRNEAELNAEGIALKHCVGSYADIHAKGKKPIFLMRRAEAPDAPFFTLQLDASELSVIQNRGKGNRKRTKEVEEFENAWLKHLREMRRAEAKTKRRRRAARDVAADAAVPA
ncbi:MAG: PcfJ domain-containing protein [Oscillospiraceae bacterium]|jgi:hypothetical protein|nr:PcfJ domain-containing protein [Oscillospiraceae bacterium]